MGVRRNTYVSDTAKTAGVAVAVTDGAGGTVILAANPSMIERTISNGHATVGIWLSLGGTPVVGQGIFLPPVGGSYTTQAYAGEIKGIATAATGSVGATEV